MRPIKNTSKLFWNVGDKITYAGDEIGGEVMTIIRKWPCREYRDCVERQNGSCSGNFFDTESLGRGISTWHDIKNDFRRYHETH